jgi:phosphatidylserine decarboxylase
MASIDKPPVGTSTVKWRFPDIHPEGRKYVLIAGAIALASLFIWDFITWPLVFLTICVAAFFRDPVRVTPQGEGLIIAPADGLVTMIERVPLPPELAGPQALGDQPMIRVSIFMSVFDVHINRSPVSGRVRKVAYIPGKFVNADLDKASEDNERQHIVVETAAGIRIGFTQIAGLVARRILTFVREGDEVEAGERVGLIRFGSRVDVYLPSGTGPRVLLGQRAIAGETVIAELGVQPELVGLSQ